MRHGRTEGGYGWTEVGKGAKGSNVPSDQSGLDRSNKEARKTGDAGRFDRGGKGVGGVELLFLSHDGVYPWHSNEGDSAQIGVQEEDLRQFG